ncbi:MAG: LysE family translocator [Terrimicrobiaceae bacterium]
MTALSAASFFGIMLALAAMPSASVALVVARSSSLGLRNGIATAGGIVTGDLVFVAIAIMGMSALAMAMGPVFSAFKYVGGAYLIWLGIKLLRSDRRVRVRSLPAKIHSQNAGRIGKSSYGESNAQSLLHELHETDLVTVGSWQICWEVGPCRPAFWAFSCAKLPWK